MKTNDQTTLFNDIARHLQQSIFTRLPEHLYYHNIAHTTLDVLPVAINIASQESVSPDDLFILKTAALFHDTGFIRQYPNNEEIGAQIAEEVLPGFGFSNGQIQRIGSIILATRISPAKDRFMQMAGEDLLEKIICDADLDNLGRDDFFEKSARLREEMSHFAMVTDEKEWIDHLVFMLETHRFYTVSARKHRGEGQQRNLAAAREKQKAL